MAWELVCERYTCFLPHSRRENRRPKTSFKAVGKCHSKWSTQPNGPHSQMAHTAKWCTQLALYMIRYILKCNLLCNCFLKVNVVWKFSSLVFISGRCLICFLQLVPLLYSGTEWTATSLHPLTTLTLGFGTWGCGNKDDIFWFPLPFSLFPFFPSLSFPLLPFPPVPQPFIKIASRSG